MIDIIFNHTLYGICSLKTNTKFKVVPQGGEITSICYTKSNGDETVHTSSIKDSGIIVKQRTLRALGY